VRILLHVIRKELLQLRQDRKMIPMLLGAPIIQLLAFGFAANLDVNRVSLLVIDSDHTRASRELVDRFASSGYFQTAGAAQNPAEADHWLISGRAQVALVIGQGYGEALAAGRSGEVQVLADGSEANSAVVGLGYASAIIAQKSSELVRARVMELAAGAALSAGQIDLLPRIWYNPDLRSRWFYVPAILAMVLMMTTMILPSMAVVREKEIGTLEQIIVTPIRSWQLIVGKLLPFALVGLLDLGLVVLVAVTLFGVPLRGSFLLLVLLSSLFILTTLGLGLLVSTLVRNQQQAMMASIYLLMVPMIYLSGLMFPIENMPRWIQYGTYGIPLRYYNIIIRGIFLRGAGMSVLWPEAVVLTLYGIGIVSLASLRFRKRLD
jgi:ABC-2 type transport system permease protein